MKSKKKEEKVKQKPRFCVYKMSVNWTAVGMIIKKDLNSLSIKYSQDQEFEPKIWDNNKQFVIEFENIYMAINFLIKETGQKPIIICNRTQKDWPSYWNKSEWNKFLKNKLN